MQAKKIRLPYWNEINWVMSSNVYFRFRNMERRIFHSVAPLFSLRYSNKYKARLPGWNIHYLNTSSKYAKRNKSKQKTFKMKRRHTYWTHRNNFAHLLPSHLYKCTVHDLRVSFGDILHLNHRTLLRTNHPLGGKMIDRWPQSLQ